MKERLNSLFTKTRVQILFFAAYVIVTAASLYFADTSVISFLLLLLSILILYFLNLGNKLKWIIGIGILGGLLPFAASHGAAYQSYMEVATFVGIYVAMALGLNIVVGFAGL